MDATHMLWRRYCLQVLVGSDINYIINDSRFNNKPTKSDFSQFVGSTFSVCNFSIKSDSTILFDSRHFRQTDQFLTSSRFQKCFELHLNDLKTRYLFCGLCKAQINLKVSSNKKLNFHHFDTLHRVVNKCFHVESGFDLFNCR